MQLSIGQRIRRLRLEHGDTLEMLAKRSGVSLATLSRLENGARSPRLNQFVDQIARAYGVTPDRLYSDPAGDFAWMVRHLDPMHRLHLLRSSFSRRAYVALRDLVGLNWQPRQPFGEAAAHIRVKEQDLHHLLSVWCLREPDTELLHSLVQAMTDQVGLPAEWFRSGFLPTEGLKQERQRQVQVAIGR